MRTYGEYYEGGNNNNGQDQEVGEIDGDVFVGPYCSNNGKKIHLGVFLEETCSVEAPNGLYEATHYGSSLPYAKKSMVDSGCVSCLEPKDIDYNNNNYWEGQQEADEATEVCT